MDPLLTVGVFLIGGAAGYILGFSRATEIYERERQELRERMRRVESGLDELEAEEQPNVEANMRSLSPMAKVLDTPPAMATVPGPTSSGASRSIREQEIDAQAHPMSFDRVGCSSWGSHSFSAFKSLRERREYHADNK